MNDVMVTLTQDVAAVCRQSNEPVTLPAGLYLKLVGAQGNQVFFESKEADEFAITLIDQGDREVKRPYQTPELRVLSPETVVSYMVT